MKRLFAFFTLVGCGFLAYFAWREDWLWVALAGWMALASIAAYRYVASEQR